MNLKSIVLFSISLLFSAQLAATELRSYTIDPVHSGITFKVRHYINMVPGTFTDFSGEVHYNPDKPSQNKIVASINPESIDTRNTRRDDHLRSDDFFDVANHTEITYLSREWQALGDGKYRVAGDLKLLGRNFPMVMEVHYLGEVEGRGVLRSGWRAKAKIDRVLWGMDYGVANGVLGGDVEVEIHLQAHRKPAD